MTSLTGQYSLEQASVLLLSASESMAALDRRSLRDVGVGQVHLLTSGIMAARLLAGLIPGKRALTPDIIVCSQTLADMDGEQFCAIIRLHPRLLGLPILLVLPNDGEVEQLRTLGCGASALLARPYSVVSLKNQLQSLCAAMPRVQQLELAALKADTKAFDDALLSYGQLLKPVRKPEDFFRVGMQCLQAGHWNNAINAFQRALRNAQIMGEAELGMAAAWRGKGDQLRFRAWLTRAAATLVQARRWHRARTAFARLLQEDPTARNPFLAQARQLMKQGHYDEAAETLQQGMELTPPEMLRHSVAQTCVSADEPKAMLEALEASLGKLLGPGAPSLADEIRQCLDALLEAQQARRREAAAQRQWEVGRIIRNKHSRQETNDRKDAPASQKAAAASAASGTENTAAARAETETAASKTGKSVASAAATAGTARATASGPLPGTGKHKGIELRSLMLDDLPEHALDVLSHEELAAVEPHLRPLSRTEASSTLFSGSPRLNELLSVVKLTWKLARRKK